MELIPNDLISKKSLLYAYDEKHKGPAGGARRLIEDMPTIPAVPLDKLCEWLGALCDTPCMIAEGICERNCQGYKPSDAECWKTVITKWMEGLDAAD